MLRFRTINSPILGPYDETTCAVTEYSSENRHRLEVEIASSIRGRQYEGKAYYRDPTDLFNKHPANRGHNIYVVFVELRPFSSGSFSSRTVEMTDGKSVEEPTKINKNKLLL